MQCGKIPEFAEELSSLSPKLTPFIIQGSQATEGEYPWVALVDLGLSGTSGNKLFCGGVLITRYPGVQVAQEGGGGGYHCPGAAGHPKLDSTPEIPAPEQVGQICCFLLPVLAHSGHSAQNSSALSSFGCPAAPEQ